jgi:hypothetical protein
MKNMKLEITHENGKIYLRFTGPDFDKAGITDYTDDLWQIINTAKWRVKGRYIYSGQRSLHRVVMEYWYGNECCEKMDEKEFVIDHIDNDGFNCLYENLEFLTRIKNWHYKGNYYDKERSKKSSIAAVNIFKNKSGNEFQITIGFNVPFHDSQGQAISKAFFAYDTPDYDLVLSDAVLLVESVGKGQINIQHLRCSRLRWEMLGYVITNGIPLMAGNVVNINGEWVIVQGDGFRIDKIAPDNSL